jgi:hypothetical protein
MVREAAVRGREGKGSAYPFNHDAAGAALDAAVGSCTCGRDLRRAVLVIAAVRDKDCGDDSRCSQSSVKVTNDDYVLSPPLGLFHSRLQFLHQEG